MSVRAPAVYHESDDSVTLTWLPIQSTALLGPILGCCPDIHGGFSFTGVSFVPT